MVELYEYNSSSITYINSSINIITAAEGKGWRYVRVHDDSVSNKD